MESWFTSWFQISRKPYATSLLERFFKQAIEKPTIAAPKKIQPFNSNVPVMDKQTIPPIDKSPSMKDPAPIKKRSFARRLGLIVVFPFYLVGLILSSPFRWIWSRLRK